MILILYPKINSGVNLAQPTRLGPGPCGLGLKMPTLKKSPIKEAHRAKNPIKALWVRANPWAFIFKMKNILFFKIYYYMWDKTNDSDKHEDPNRPNYLDLPDDPEKLDDPDGSNDPNGLDNLDRPDGPDDLDEPDDLNKPDASDETDYLDRTDDPDEPVDPELPDDPDGPDDLD